MRDEALLILKLKWGTARPIRNARDYEAFTHQQLLHSKSVKNAEIMLGALASVTLTPALLLRLHSERCGGNVL